MRSCSPANKQLLCKWVMCTHKTSRSVELSQGTHTPPLPPQAHKRTHHTTPKTTHTQKLLGERVIWGEKKQKFGFEGISYQIYVSEAVTVCYIHVMVDQFYLHLYTDYSQRCEHIHHPSDDYGDLPARQLWIHSSNSNPARPSTALRSKASPSPSIKLLRRSIDVSEGLSRIAGASAFAPSGPILLRPRLIEVSEAVTAMEAAIALMPSAL